MARKPLRKMAKPKRPYKTKSKGTTSITKAVKTYVNRAIHKQIENKQANIIDDILIGPWFGQVNLQCHPLMPVPMGTPTGGIHIDQGVGQSDRVGNTIRTRKLLFRYIMTPAIQDQALNPQPVPQEVRVFFGYLKNQRMVQPDVSYFNKLYQFGNSATSPFNNLWDITMPVNNDLFHVCKQVRHRVGNSVYTDYAGIKPNNYYTNNDFSLNVTRTLDLTKYINKVLKFDDTSGTCDTGLYVWFISVNADGSDTINTISSVRVQYSLTYEYEDA